MPAERSAPAFRLSFFQVRHRRTCREARAPKEISSARLCDPPEAQLSAAGDNPLLKVVLLPFVISFEQFLKFFV